MLKCLIRIWVFVFLEVLFIYASFNIILLIYDEGLLFMFPLMFSCPGEEVVRQKVIYLFLSMVACLLLC